VRKILALVVSVVFQPLIVPTLVFGLIFFVVPESTSLPTESKMGIFYLVVLSTLVIPMITIFGLRLSGTLKSLHMETIQDRLIPFSITSTYYLLTLYFIYDKSDFDPILWKSLGIITFAIIILTFVTFFWKISAHMTGMGGLMAVVLVLGFKFPNFKALYPLLLSITLTGVVGTSRLYLTAHRPIEVYVGLIFGFIVCFFGFSYVWA
jgi:membrane-associated phospholipid phosphatase